MPRTRFLSKQGPQGVKGDPGPSTNNTNQFIGIADLTKAQDFNATFVANTPLTLVPSSDAPGVATLRTRLQALADNIATGRKYVLAFPSGTVNIDQPLVIKNDTPVQGGYGQSYGHASLCNISTTPGLIPGIKNLYQGASVLRSSIQNIGLTLTNTVGTGEAGIELTRAGQWSLGKIFANSNSQAGNFAKFQDCDAMSFFEVRCMESQGRMWEVGWRCQDMWHWGLDLEATSGQVADGMFVSAYRMYDPANTTSYSAPTSVLKHQRVSFWGTQLERVGKFTINSGMTLVDTCQLTGTSLLLGERSALAKIRGAGGSAPDSYIWNFGYSNTIEQSNALNWLANKPVTLGANCVRMTGANAADPAHSAYVPGKGAEWFFMSYQLGEATATVNTGIRYQRADSTVIEDSPLVDYYNPGGQNFSLVMRDSRTYITCLGTASDRLVVTPINTNCPVMPGAYRNKITNGTFGGATDNPGSSTTGWSTTGSTATLATAQTMPGSTETGKWISYTGTGTNGAGGMWQLVPVRPGGTYLIMARVSTGAELYVGQGWNATANRRNAKSVCPSDFTYPDGSSLLQIVYEVPAGWNSAHLQVTLGSATAGGPHYVKWVALVDLDEQPVCWTAGPPTEGVWAKDDFTMEIAPVAGGPTKWICVTAGTAGSTAVFRGAEFSAPGLGNTAGRPQSLTSAHRGTQYLDTTLAAAGKLITWTGTAWVDATGATA